MSEGSFLHLRSASVDTSEIGGVEGVPLLPAQKWYLRNVKSHSDWCIKTRFYANRGTLEEDLLQVAWELVSESNQAMRCIARKIESTPIQILAFESVASLKQWKNSGSSQEEFREANPGDLPLGSLFQLSVKDEEESRISVSFDLHHFLCDGMSHRMVVDEVLGNYEKLRLGLHPKIRSTPALADVHGRKRRFEAQVLENSQKYLDYLRGAAPSNILRRSLSSNFEEMNIAANSAQSVGTIDHAIFQRLRKFAAKSGRFSFLDILLWALLAALSSFFETNRIRLYIIDAGRGGADLQGVDAKAVVGWLSTKLLLDLALDDDRTLEDQIESIASQKRDAPAGGLWFEYMSEVMEESHLYGISENRVVFNFQGLTDWYSQHQKIGFTYVEPEITSAVVGHSRRDCLFYIEASVRDNGLHLLWHFNKFEHEKAEMDSMLRNMIERLSAVK